MNAYYNEIDPKAAAWLRELIKQGHIAPGEVDERSIADVKPGELVGYTQCHFFAGIGVWSYALRTAGWPDDRPVWTGSCPCQPFSAAGKRGGTDDARHLWPEFFRLIAECRPPTVFGEQVASKDGLTWLDAVHSDLEGAGYAVGAVDTCAAGFGAPHIRQRLYFVADAQCERTKWRDSHQNRPSDERSECGGELPSTVGQNGFVDFLVQPIGPRVGGRDQRGLGDPREEIQEQDDGAHPPIEPRYGGEDAGGVADADDKGSQGRGRAELQERAGECASWPNGGVGGILAYPDGGNSGAEREQRGGEHGQQPEDRGPCNGFWSDATWISCRDGKARPVEPGTFPLAHGAPARVGRLRGYGNGLVAPQATAFVRAYMETLPRP